MPRVSTAGISLCLLLILTSGLALSACGGGEPPAPGPSVRQVLEDSAVAMAEVRTFRFDLRNEGGETPLPTGLRLRSARGVMASPDRLDVSVKALFSGFLVEVRVISIGERTYMTDPLTGDWRTFESGLSPVAFFDPAKGVGLILRNVTEATLLGEEEVDGVATHRIGGRIPSSAVQFIAGSFLEGAVLEAELFIGKADHLLRRVWLDGRITEDEAPGIIRVFSMSDFDEPTTVEAPR